MRGDEQEAVRAVGALGRSEEVCGGCGRRAEGEDRQAQTEKAQAPLGQQRSEGVYDAARDDRQVPERPQKAFTFDDPDLVNRYVEGEVELHVCLRYIGPGKPADSCAVFKAQQPARLHDGHGHSDGAALTGRFDCAVPRPGGSEHECAVFVDNVQTFEPPKVGIPSLVRLDLAENAHRLRTGLSYFSLTSFNKVTLGPTNGEIRLVSGLVSVGSHQLAGEVIEGGAKIVESITSDDGDVQGDGFSDVRYAEIVSGLRIFIAPNRVRLGSEKGLGFFFEVADMLVGPLDFLADFRDTHALPVRLL